MGALNRAVTANNIETFDEFKCERRERNEVDDGWTDWGGWSDVTTGGYHCGRDPNDNNGDPASIQKNQRLAVGTTAGLMRYSMKIESPPCPS